MTKECIICGTTFASTRFWTKTCSKECSYELIKFNARSNSKKNYRLKNPQDRYLIDMNEIIEEKDYLKVIVYTNKNKYKGFFIADKEDLDLINKFLIQNQPLEMKIKDYTGWGVFWETAVELEPQIENK